MTENVQDLNINYKILLKKMNRWILLTCEDSVLLRRLSTIKMSVLLPIISRFNTISIKIPVGIFFLEIDKSFLKFLSKFKLPKKATKNPAIEKCWRIYPDFQTSYKGIVIKSFSQQGRQINPQNRTERKERLAIYSQLIFNKDETPIQ